MGNQPPMSVMSQMGKMTAEDRAAAAKRAKAARDAATRAKLPIAMQPAPGGAPDYFGIYPNYANSPVPDIDPTSGNVISGTGIRKFVDGLPGLGPTGANDLGQYMPVAFADITTYPGSDYYEIALVQYREKMHSDLPATLLREYVQIETSANITVSHHFALVNDLVDGTQVPVLDINGNQVYAVDAPHYLGPVIVSNKDLPTRIKFTNYLPIGSGGDLFIPTDTTDMGAGLGPLGGTEMYTQNRAVVHLHGGVTPWISDGTPHQWITPAGENTDYPEGVSVQNVPDMPDPGPGSVTLFYTNQQSARLMFYHDHAYGITRLNVYAGVAAGYLLTDQTEQNLINTGVLPDLGIPLVIQDKTFVPSDVPNNRYPVDATNSRGQLGAQDPTWDTTKYGGLGNLWFPHVYMTNQNPWDVSGANAMGRWDYGQWFWPPFVIAHGPVTNTYAALPGEPPMVPGTPNPSLVPEGFMDTPVINGTAYPVLTVDPKSYRFRILNAANDRFWNLSLYVAASDNPMWNPDGTLNDANAGEVPMVPAVPNPAIPFPTDWTTASDGAGIRPDILDGRPSGVPDPMHLGPSWVMIGTEGGFLPTPVTLDPKPTGYQYNLRNIVVTNVTKHSLYMGPAERADVVVDFSQFAGKTLILYNDAPAPNPAGDLRNDYYTGDIDRSYQTGDGTGGAPTTLPGYGPNIRTVMQIKVASVAAGGDALTNVVVSDSGSDYTAMPVVDIASPNFITGTNAAATAFGAVESIPMSTAGTGYTSVPSVTVSGGGAITDAVATATIKNGKVTAITVVNGGSGYASAPTVSITGGGGSGATANAVLKVSYVTIADGGSGYTSAPEINFLGGGGYGAAAHAFLAAGVSFDRAALDAAFTGPNSVFATSQDPIIVPQEAYNSAYSETLPSDAYARIQDTSMTFTPRGSATPLTLGMGPKAIQELFEVEYGRMNATLGVEIPNTNATVQTTIPYGYIDPTTEIITDSMTAMSPVLGDGTQIWKITHNGVDTHAIHFHLFNVQIINRVGWDGAIRPPDPEELGWKETVKMNQLEDVIVALRPIAPKQPFNLPNSVRPMDPARPIGSTMGFFGQDPNGNPVTVINQLANFGWEYVWHCHLLGHEENDMMRPMQFNVISTLPPALTLSPLSTAGSTSAAPQAILQWTDPTPVMPANVGNPANEIGFGIQRAPGASGGTFITVAVALANQTIFTDTSVGTGTTYRYRVNAFNQAGGRLSNVQSVSFVTGLKPIAPTNLVATSQTGPRVALSWTDNATNETGFVIERTQVGSTTWTQIPVGQHPGTGNVTYNDTSVTVATTYSYRVRTVRAGISSAYSNIATVAVLPNAPTNLQVPSNAATRTTLTLVWTRNQLTPPATGYEIWSSPNGTTWTLVATVGNVTTYTDTGLTPNTRYYYQVRAYMLGAAPLSIAYYSGYSNSANRTTRR